MGAALSVLRKKYRALVDHLDERGRRVWAAAEAGSLPRGGVSLVARATGLSRTTIHAGIRELQQRRRKPLAPGRSRRAGGGRKPLTFPHPELLKALEQLLEPVARGDPESFLRWTAKSTRKLAAELKRQGYRIGDRKVAQLLHQMGYKSAGQRQDSGGQAASGPHRAVRVRSPPGQAVPGAGPAGHFRRHQEERTRGKL